MTVREPLLHPVPLKDLRPTQISVGLREVNEKRRQWREHSDSNTSEFLGKHMIPVVLGPKDHRYVIDHHHLCRALMDEGVKDILVSIVADPYVGPPIVQSCDPSVPSLPTKYS